MAIVRPRTELAVVMLESSTFLQRAGEHPPAVRWPDLRRIANELAEAAALCRLVLVHEADGHTIGDFVAASPLSAATVSGMGQTFDRVQASLVMSLHQAGIAAHSCSALQLAVQHGQDLHLRGTSLLPEMFGRGLVPVIGSTAIADADSGHFAVARGDVLATRVARALGADLLAQVLGPDAPAAPPHPRLAAAMEAADAGIRTLVVHGDQPGNLSLALRGEPFQGTHVTAAPRMWPR